MPLSILEAMAASRAVAATDVGDIETMLAEENRPFVAPRDAARWKCRPVSVASHGKVVGVSTRSPMQK
jgi:hypothetical protein